MSGNYRKKQAVVVAVDVVLLFFSFYLSHLIRFEFNIPGWGYEKFIEMFPLIVVVKLACFYVFDLYRGMWRYTSLNDLFIIIKASTVSSLVVITAILFINRFEMVSRSVFIIDWCLTIMFITGVRVATRLCFEEFTGKITFSDLVNALMKIFNRRPLESKGVIIIGAGDCGQKICREFIENPMVQSHVVGFLDDDPGKIGRKIHGIPVLAPIDELKNVVASTGVEDVVISIPSLSAAGMRHIVDLCKNADVEFKTVPSMGELIDGKIQLSAIRKVEYRDLLGREPVHLDKDKIGDYLGGKRVLVTGAGGSIGKGLCRQIGRFSPEQIILFERAESPLYEIDLELKKNFPHIGIIPVLGDIQNQKEIVDTFSRTRPQIVFHAAAYKHVPMLEQFPLKAVENNIVGTANIIDTARKYACEKFVFVSTDKAVNPTSVMGTTKRIAEILIQKANRCQVPGTHFITVRFGNVIGSVGSVIPLFKKQIKQGGPVTVTHPDMIRYFMLIPEACQLILQAGAMGQGGEIFILEMGKPVKIDSMARDLIRFSGLEPDVDIKIEYTGLRPGEKLYEELITDQENVVSTEHHKIMVLNCRQDVMDDIENKIDALKTFAGKGEHDQVRLLLKDIVPEYHCAADSGAVN